MVAKSKIKEFRDISLFEEAMLNNTSILVYIADNDFNLIFWNKAAEIVSGYKRKEVLGDCLVWEWLYPDNNYRQKVFRKMEVFSAKNKDVGRFDTRISPKEGEEKCISWSPIGLHEDGKRVGFLTFGIDITERGKIQEALKESEERFKLFSRYFPGAAYIKDESGKYIFYNDFFVEEFGWEKEIYLGNTDYDLWSKEVAKKFRESDRKVLEIKAPIKDEEKVVIDGKDKVFFSYKFPIFSKEQMLIGGISVDITDRKRMESKLKESERRYRGLFNNSRDGIYISTLDGWYIDANPALVEMLGYDSKEDLLRINIEKDLYVKKDYRPLPQERGEPFEAQLRKKDGTVFWAEISSKVVYIEGKPAYYEGIVRDITKRKRYEQELHYRSFHDSLTGLYNRAYFEEELERLNKKRQLPLSIIMCDINNLKLVNDAFGHYKGDKLIKSAANILREACRTEDIIARWGGDEFVILLPQTGEKILMDIVGRINSITKKTYSEEIPVSISIGVSTKKELARDIKKILNQAENNMYKQKMLNRKSILGSVISSMEKNLVKRNIEPEGHIERVKQLAVQLGKEAKLPKGKLENLELAARLHDIGKISLPDRILKKSDNLTDGEWEKVKLHPEVGYNITESSPILSHISEAILSHHEWWDGTGYPQGLSGNSIPIISRILAIAESFDVMVYGGAYKKPIPKKQALDKIRENAGSQFDPFLVDKFIEIVEGK
ncbi:MAG: PAS domain S-box protein [Actinomycetota bacterium]